MNAFVDGNSSRRYLALAAALALAACGGGGGASGAAPVSPGGTTPLAVFATPTFVIRIPARKGSSSKRKPAFVSSGTLSVKIALTADSLSIDPTTLAGNPATTNVSSGSCSSGCTVSGPPSPIGSDTFTITTYDVNDAGGHALDTNSATFTIAQGVNNSETITLNGIPASIVIGTLNNFPAGTSASYLVGGPASGGVAVTVSDADLEVITGTYANPVTVSDPDTNSDGTSLQTSCPTSYSTGNPAAAATSVQFTSDTSQTTFCYGGLAEYPVTLSATATSVSGGNSGSSIFTPTLNPPTYVSGSGTPSSVVVEGNPVQINLYALSGTGSTGSEKFSESGWTDAPYDRVLISLADQACSSGGPFATYAIFGPEGSDSGGTTISVTVIGSPTAGACPVSISDGLTSNGTDVPATLDTSYTSSSFGVNSIHRRPPH
jgi:hypothetical protein